MSILPPMRRPRRTAARWLLPLAWGVTTLVLFLGQSASCTFATLLPGARPGSECLGGPPPSERLSGLVVPPVGSEDDPVFWAQLVFNVVWFLPLGWWTIRRSRRALAPMVIGLLVGGLIELGQWLLTSTRYPSLLDAALNGIGAAIGGRWAMATGGDTADHLRGPDG